MLLVSILIVVSSLLAEATDESNKDTASIQIVIYNETHTEPTGNLTDNGGARVEYDTVHNSLNSNLIRNSFVFETISHVVRSVIPERVVHGKGAGAFGYFIVTHDVTNITKADFLSDIDKVTPVTVRFSTAVTSRHGIDTAREPRGFAIKFYTEEGNFDMIGLSTPVFVFKEPAKFSSLVHSQNPNPVTNIPQDPNTIWDFISNVKESLNIFTRLFGYVGIPDGYRHMSGYSVHTMQMVNAEGESTFVKFIFKPHAGFKYLNSTQASNLAATDPEYATKDLYNAIDNGDYPCWTMYFQVFTKDDVETLGDAVFDVTKSISETDYPPQPVGELCLNRNPSNYHADVEQVAFCPCTLVRGILGGCDKLFESRCFAYREAQMYRLHANYYNIDVNYPYRSKILNYNRDGFPPVRSNGEGRPNYYWNSFNGVEPYKEENSTKLLSITEKPGNNSQWVSELYNEMSEDERNYTITNIVSSLSGATAAIQDKIVNIYKEINETLGYSIYKGLLAAVSSS